MPTLQPIVVYLHRNISLQIIWGGLFLSTFYLAKDWTYWYGPLPRFAHKPFMWFSVAVTG